MNRTPTHTHALIVPVPHTCGDEPAAPTRFFVARTVPATDPAEQVLLDNYRRCGAQAKQNLIQTAALLSAGLGSSAIATPATSSKPRTRSAAGGRGNIRIDGTVHGHVVQGDVVQHGPVSMAQARTVGG